MQTTCSVVNDSYFNRRYVHGNDWCCTFIDTYFWELRHSLVAGSAAALNHVADQHIDKLMKVLSIDQLLKAKFLREIA